MIAFAAMTTLFFVWGFLTSLNDILIPHLKGAFELNYAQVMLVQFCFFGAYFIVSPIAGKLIDRVGYRRGVIFSLLVMAAGCGLFYPAAEVEMYSVFLLGLFVLASGITILQVSANPYVSALGPERTAVSRLNLAQGLNSLGHTLGPLFGAFLILSASNETAASAQAVQTPYLILAGALIVTALAFSRLQLPTLEHIESNSAETVDTSSILAQKRVLLGALAIFLYVGAEVSIGSFLVNFFAEEHIGGLSAQEGGKMVSYYWGMAMIGRFVGAVVTRFVSAGFVLAFNSICAITLIGMTLMGQGEWAMWSIVAVGFFNSVMFPTIFALTIRGLGTATSRGSALLCQAIVGGAILPLVQGVLADATTVQFSFIAPACCYVYIAWYALRQQLPLTSAP